MPSMIKSLALAGALCGVASGFVAQPGSALHAQVRASASRRVAPAARQGLSMSSIYDTEGSLDFLFERNRQWAAEQDPAMFAELKKGQSPRFLYFGCSDSRVPAQNMLGLNPGELFVHRNVANLVLNNDISMLSVLKYSVEVLGVTDIIVCGHTGCGGVKAAMANTDHGLLEQWLINIRNVQRLHKAELDAIADEDERHQRLVELNVQEQCLNLFNNPIVQKKQLEAGVPRIHGWVYDIGTGLLEDLKVDFKSEIAQVKDIYQLYDFPTGAGIPPPNSSAMTPRKKTTPNPPAPKAPQQVTYSAQPASPSAPAVNVLIEVNNNGSSREGSAAERFNSRYGERMPYKLGL